MDKKVYMIQIKNDVIKNPSLSAKAFALYVVVVLLHGMFKGKVNVKSATLLRYVGWKYVKQLKRYLLELHDSGLVKERYNTLPKHSTIALTPLIMVAKGDSKFTQLPTNTLYWINDVGEIGLRLLYYYQSHINASACNFEAYPCYETIQKELGICDNTVTLYNNLLKHHGLISFHAKKREGKNGKQMAYPNNHYSVNLQNILQRSKGDLVSEAKTQITSRNGIVKEKKTKQRNNTNQSELLSILDEMEKEGTTIALKDSNESIKNESKVKLQIDENESESELLRILDEMERQETNSALKKNDRLSRDSRFDEETRPPQEDANQAINELWDWLNSEEP